MRRFLCFSLCLGLMVSACKKKSVEESVNKAISKAGGGGGGDEATAVTKKDKAAVLKACLPLINTRMLKKWNLASNNFFLRRSTDWKTSAAVPLVVLYTAEGMPLQFTKDHGLGKDAAAVTKNLNEMAASEVIQDQFVARDGNASGWRVHISRANTDVRIPESKVGEPPPAPEANSGIIIYDRENVVSRGISTSVLAKSAKKKGVGTLPLSPRENARDANSENFRGGWFDCVVNDTTEAVTLKYADAEFT